MDTPQVNNRQRLLLDTLSGLARELNAAPNLDAALDLILCHMERVLTFDSGSVLLLEGNGLRVAAVQGFEAPDRVVGARFDLDTALLNREVIETQRPLIVGSVADDPQWLRSRGDKGLSPELARIHSWMGVPMLIQNRVIGMLTADKVEPDFYNGQDAELALAFAGHAAIALENARLVAAARRQAEQLEALRQVSQELIALQDLDTLLQQIVERAIQLLEADNGGVYLYRPERQELEWVVAVGETVKWLGTTLQRGEGLSGKVWDTGAPIIVGNYHSWPGKSPKWAGLSTSVIGVPIQWGDQFLGVLNVGTEGVEKDRFAPKDATLLAQFAAQAAIAIQNVRLYEQAQQEIAERKQVETELERLLADLKWRNTQLQTAITVSKSASTLLDPDKLMSQTVNLIQQRFDFYYVGIFLLDEAGEYAVLRAGTGEAGEQMIAEGHRLLVGGESMVGWAVTHAQVRIALDVGQEAVRFDNPYLPQTRSEMALPLVTRGEAIGALTVQSSKEAAFSEEDVAILQSMADHVVVAMENARLFAAARRQTEQLDALRQVSQDLIALHHLDALLQQIVERAVQLLDGKAGGMYLYHPDRDILEWVVGVREDPTLVGLTISRGEGLSGKVWDTGEPLIVDDYQSWPGRSSQWAGFPVRAAMSVPIQWGGEFLGVLHIHTGNTQRRFTPQDAALLSQFATQAAIAIQNARLHEQAHQEIAERRRTEEELRRLKEFNESIVQNIAEGIVVEDAEGHFTFVNPAAAALLGYTPEELVGQHWTAVIAPDKHAIVEAADRRRLRGQTDRYELELLHKGGERIPVLVSGCPIFERGRFAGTLAVFTDITERVQGEEEKQTLQEELARAQRMESLGVLAGGVAHELNNILGPLVAYPDLILMDLLPDSPVRNDVIRIKDSAERAVAAVQDLLALARRGAYRMFPLNLNSIIKDFLESPSFAELKASHPNVIVVENLATDLLNISGSGPHLFKVVMNLVLNAFEAMPYGGRLGITTHCVSLERPILGYDYIEAKDYVVFQVSDTGVGVEQDDLGRIFEPFYTKKKMGRSGSGLGLAVVYGVVQDHGGRIDVQTQVGKGTDFIVYFPITRERLLELEDVSADYGGNETVLVVDDLAEQRELAARLLSSLGYQVQTVDSGQAAIEYLAQAPADILILDMIMEDSFDGLDTFREIVKIRPGQKAIIVSGFSETDRVREAQQLGASRFVKKPYTLENIGQAVRQELDRG